MADEVTAKTFSKWNSRRWIITVWSALLVTTLFFWCMITRYSPDWISVAMGLLLAIPSVYIAGDSLTKTKTS
jgi:membrane protein YdbS with pleckstrin-like domain